MHMGSEASNARVEEINNLLLSIQAMIDDQNQSAKEAIDRKQTFCTEAVGNFEKQLEQQQAKQTDNQEEL